MNDINELFFSLIRVAIGTQDTLPYAPSAEEWKQLYDMAKKQSLVGICFAALQKLTLQRNENEYENENRIHSKDPEAKPAEYQDLEPCEVMAKYWNMPEMLYLKWMGMAAKIQQRNEIVNKQCVELQKKLSAKGFRSSILKGQANHTHYGDDLAMQRQSGDIDIWVEGGRKKVVELVNSICPTKEIRETHAQLHLFDDTEVEAHYRPGLIRDFRRNKRLQTFFQKNAEMCFCNKVKFACGEIVAPTVAFNAVQQLLHIYHHLFDSGIGLRQVTDYYFVLRHLRSEEKEDVVKILKSVGVERFARALMYVQTEVFGIDNRFLLCEPSKMDGEYLLSEIMEAGNFGHHDSRRTHHERDSFIRSFFGVYFKNFRHARFAPMEWFWSPIWRLYYFGWRKVNGYH